MICQVRAHSSPIRICGADGKHPWQAERRGFMASANPECPFWNLNAASIAQLTIYGFPGGPRPVTRKMDPLSGVDPWPNPYLAFSQLTGVPLRAAPMLVLSQSSEGWVPDNDHSSEMLGFVSWNEWLGCCFGFISSSEDVLILYRGCSLLLWYSSRHHVASIRPSRKASQCSILCSWYSIITEEGLVMDIFGDLG